jgi:hypothetical protein
MTQDEHFARLSRAYLPVKHDEQLMSSALRRTLNAYMTRASIRLSKSASETRAHRAMMPRYAGLKARHLLAIYYRVIRTRMLLYLFIDRLSGLNYMLMLLLSVLISNAEPTRERASSCHYYYTIHDTIRAIIRRIRDRRKEPPSEHFIRRAREAPPRQYD